MKRVKSLSSLPDAFPPLCVAIGSFDGVHLGHKTLITEMKCWGSAIIFTFSNHPTAVLPHVTKVPTLISPQQKEDLLEKAGGDYCIMQPFTPDIASMPYHIFLEEVYQAIPFSHIFFGEGDAIGKNREGTPEKVISLGEKLGFKAHYLPKYTIEGKQVSSSAVRKALAKCDFALAEKLLGRPYTAEISVEAPQIDCGLLPPGCYTVSQPPDPTPVTIEIDDEGNIFFTDEVQWPGDRSTLLLTFQTIGKTHV